MSVSVGHVIMMADVLTSLLILRVPVSRDSQVRSCYGYYVLNIGSTVS